MATTVGRRRGEPAGTTIALLTGDMGDWWQQHTISYGRSTIVPPPRSSREPDCYSTLFPLDLLDEDLPEDTITEPSPAGLQRGPGVMEPDAQGITEMAPATLRAPSPWPECMRGDALESYSAGAGTMA